MRFCLLFVGLSFWLGSNGFGTDSIGVGFYDGKGHWFDPSGKKVSYTKKMVTESYKNRHTYKIEMKWVEGGEEKKQKFRLKTIPAGDNRFDILVSGEKVGFGSYMDGDGDEWSEYDQLQNMQYEYEGASVTLSSYYQYKNKTYFNTGSITVEGKTVTFFEELNPSP